MIIFLTRQKLFWSDGNSSDQTKNSSDQTEILLTSQKFFWSDRWKEKGIRPTIKERCFYWWCKNFQDNKRERHYPTNDEIKIFRTIKEKGIRPTIMLLLMMRFRYAQFYYNGMFPLATGEDIIKHSPLRYWLSIHICIILILRRQNHIDH